MYCLAHADVDGKVTGIVTWSSGAVIIGNEGDLNGECFQIRISIVDLTMYCLAQ
jgi:cytoskeletal protein CcmA (bactofilin family)